MQTMRLCVVAGVEHGLHVLALPAAIAERGDRRGRIAPEPVGEGGIAPGLRDDMRAVPRPDLVLVGLDDDIDRLGIDEALAHEDGLERPDPRRHRRELVVVVMVVIVVVVVIVHPARLALRRVRRHWYQPVLEDRADAGAFGRDLHGEVAHRRAIEDIGRQRHQCRVAMERLKIDGLDGDEASRVEIVDDGGANESAEPRTPNREAPRWAGR